MKVIIAGGRDVTDYAIVRRAIEASGFEITEVVSGTCRGADLLGERWAASRGVPVKRFPADWAAHGKAAGPIRNAHMAQYADALILFDTGGPGSYSMARAAHNAMLRVFRVTP